MREQAKNINRAYYQERYKNMSVQELQSQLEWNQLTLAREHGHYEYEELVIRTEVAKDLLAEKILLEE